MNRPIARACAAAALAALTLTSCSNNNTATSPTPNPANVPSAQNLCAMVYDTGGIVTTASYTLTVVHP